MLEVKARPTPLHDRHVALGAALVNFAGWEMPVHYTGILAEHRAVRERAGLFDLSHMGELFVEGRQAAPALFYSIVTNPELLTVGRAQYSMICTPDGGIIDDLIVYRLAEDRFLIVANASNVAVVRQALAERTAGFPAALVDRSEETALVAIQGPRSVGILQRLVDIDLAAIRYYAIAPARVTGIEALVARTGYTGEDGFELFVSADRAADVWDRVFEAGGPAGLVPVGLGARDSLRLEAGMPLYGSELDRSTTPFDAGLGRVVHLDKVGDFVGRQALEAAARRGPSRSLVGLAVRGRGIARHGHRVWTDDGPVGVVTSGSHSPTLERAIAMAYVPPAVAQPGRMLSVEIRDQMVPVEIVALPFYKRAR